MHLRQISPHTFSALHVPVPPPVRNPGTPTGHPAARPTTTPRHDHPQAAGAGLHVQAVLHPAAQTHLPAGLRAGRGHRDVRGLPGAPRDRRQSGLVFGPQREAQHRGDSGGEGRTRHAG